MILRELVATFGLSVDRKGFQEAKSGLEGLSSMVRNLGIGLGVGGIVSGLLRVATAASDVNESLAVIEQTFQDNTQGVLEWAKAQGEAMGRSEYQLRQMAGSMGALLVPMMEFDREKAAGMSKTISQLAVDLGAFFNIADDDALAKLRSGLMGETEAIEGVGVSIKQAALAEFAQKKGIHGSITKMKESEKVWLRYLKILEDTKDKQGAAKREAGSYANQVKRLQASIHDLEVGAGRRILSTINSIIGGIRWMTDGLFEAVEASRIFESGLITLGALLVPFAIQMAIANAPILAFAAGLFLVAAAIDEIWKTYEGGKTIIGDIMTSILGPAEGKRWMASWKEAVEAYGHLAYDVMQGPGLKKGIENFKNRIGSGVNGTDIAQALFGRESRIGVMGNKANEEFEREQAEAKKLFDAKKKREAEEAKRHKAEYSAMPPVHEVARRLMGHDVAAGPGINAPLANPEGTPKVVIVNVDGNADDTTVRKIRRVAEDVVDGKRTNAMNTSRTKPRKSRGK